MIDPALSETEWEESLVSWYRAQPECALMSNLLTRAGMDAMVWAEEFCRILDGKTIKTSGEDDDPDSINVGTMIGWFANSIMAGYDRGHTRGAHKALERLIQEANNFTRNTQP